MGALCVLICLGLVAGHFLAVGACAARAVIAPQFLWLASTNGSLGSPPAISNATVFVAGRTKLIALSESAGLAQAQFVVPEGRTVTSTPAVVNGRVVAGASGGPVGSSGMLYCLDSSLGSVLWSTAFPGGIASVRASADGKMAFATTQRRLFAVDTASGAIRWSRLLAGPAWSLSAPTLAGGNVIVSADSVHAVDQATGALRWRLNTTGASYFVGACGSGVLVSGGPTTYLIDPRSGAVRWAVQQQLFGGTCSNATVVGGSFSLYPIVALDVGSGKPRWSRGINGDSINGFPVIAGDVAYAGTVHGQVMALSVTTGATLWAFPLPAPSPTVTSLGVVDGYLYATTPSDLASFLVGA